MKLIFKFWSKTFFCFKK